MSPDVRRALQFPLRNPHIAPAAPPREVPPEPTTTRSQPRSPSRARAVFYRVGSRDVAAVRERESKTPDRKLRELMGAVKGA